MGVAVVSTSDPQLTISSRGWVVQAVPFIFALAAFILSASSVSSCRFLVMESVTYDSVTGLSLLSDPQPIGLFRYGGIDNGVCQTMRHRRGYINKLNQVTPGSNEKLPIELNVAEAGGILACLFGFTALCLIFSAFFSALTLKRPVWRIVLPVLLNLAAVFQLMTFAGFGAPACKADRDDRLSVVTCTFNQGANQSLAAAVLYLMLGIGIIFFPKRSVPLCNIQAADDVETASNYMHSTTYEKVPSQEVVMVRQKMTHQHETTTTSPQQHAPPIVSAQGGNEPNYMTSPPTAPPESSSTTPLADNSLSHHDSEATPRMAANNSSLRGEEKNDQETPPMADYSLSSHHHGEATPMTSNSSSREHHHITINQTTPMTTDYSSSSHHHYHHQKDHQETPLTDQETPLTDQSSSRQSEEASPFLGQNGGGDGLFMRDESSSSHRHHHHHHRKGGRRRSSSNKKSSRSSKKHRTPSSMEQRRRSSSTTTERRREDNNREDELPPPIDGEGEIDIEMFDES